MKEDMKPTPQPAHTASIKDRVFSTIDEQHVEPRPCYVFWCQNSVMWLIWLVTVLLGALATAVLWFTSTYRYYDIYEAMHDNFVTFFLQALPLLWIFAFIILMVVAMQGLRATRRGYRLSPALVGGSSIGLSILLGMVASVLGFGHVVDRTLGEYAPMYSSMADREEQMWLQPSEGRLVGRVAEFVVADVDHVTFTDVSGVDWLVNTTELRPFDRDLLNSQRQVRVLGAQIAGEKADFHACGVFPWLMDKSWQLKELSEQRRVAVERMYGHKEDQQGRIDRLEHKAFDDASATNTPSMKVCASIAAVRRISEQMR